MELQLPPNQVADFLFGYDRALALWSFNFSLFHSKEDLFFSQHGGFALAGAYFRFRELPTVWL